MAAITASEDEAQALVPHGGAAPQLGHHLRHHGAQVRLLALQLAKGVADVDGLDGVGIEAAGFQRAEVDSRIMSEMSWSARAQDLAKSVW
jgi:hypothetical protein